MFGILVAAIKNNASRRGVNATSITVAADAIRFLNSCGFNVWDNVPFDKNQRRITVCITDKCDTNGFDATMRKCKWHNPFIVEISQADLCYIYEKIGTASLRGMRVVFRTLSEVMNRYLASDNLRNMIMNTAPDKFWDKVLEFISYNSLVRDFNSAANIRRFVEVVGGYEGLLVIIDNAIKYALSSSDEPIVKRCYRCKRAYIDRETGKWSCDSFTFSGGFDFEVKSTTEMLRLYPDLFLGEDNELTTRCIPASAEITRCGCYHSR